jgi:uncharacterized repeat protein (TIGR02543 family)
LNAVFLSSPSIRLHMVLECFVKKTPWRINLYGKKSRRDSARLTIDVILLGVSILVLAGCPDPTVPAGYTITYDRNGADGGNVPEEANTYLQDATVTVLGNSELLTKIGYTFDGWNTNENGTGTSYVAGDTIAMPAYDFTLYAQWTRNVTYHDFGTESSIYTSIQDAIDSVVLDDGNRHVIKVAAGTYDEYLIIDRRISIQGTLDAEGAKSTVIYSADPPVVTGGETYPAGYRPTIQVNVSGTADDYISLEDLRIEQRQDIVGAAYQLPAILLQPQAEISYVELKNVSVTGTSSLGTPEQGITVDGSTDLEYLVIEDSEFKNMGYGIIFYNHILGPTALKNIQITDCSFSNNSIKGFYAEKLSDAIFTRVSVTDNGNTSLSPSWAIKTNAGIDINLKAGDYQNLTFTDCIVTGNGPGSLNGAGLAVKARGTGDDSATYTSNPATLKHVVVDGGTYTGNNSCDIRFGEVDVDGVSLNNTSPTNVTVMSNVAYGEAKLLNEVSGLTISN